ncbi:MAG: lytic murein transglycosylase [Acidimicrobiales bacterium]|nr:MAG: lytic murein transglycosylase [Acidimicrobiales bacterium]
MTGIVARITCLFLCIALSGCVTTRPVEPVADEPVPIVETPDLETAPIATPDPTPTPPIIAQPEPDPTPVPAPPTPAPPEEPVYELKSGYDELPYWSRSNPLPALKSFIQSCELWARREDGDWLNPNLPDYGRIRDWLPACAEAAQTPLDTYAARGFFQTHFEPVQLATSTQNAGKLTGYYAPQIDVKRRADAVYSEPILARPSSAALQNQPRKNINATTSRVLAYGRPMEVFFLQIQGSGRIKFPDGTVYRAAYDGHNSHKYVSIGKLLVTRGELTLEQSSKQSIEDWMVRAGPVKARALMNENPRYIFFKTETLSGDLGPKGAMRVPLTAMGSLAVDPRYHPYGALVWIRAKLPQYGGDYTGAESGFLVSAQDTGNAIRGPMRGDLYYGAGDEAGAKAGVTKHQAIWTLFLPRGIALRALILS